MKTVSVDRPNDLGPALREIRLDLAITQTALAEAAHVGRQWLNAFEMGDKPSAPLDMVFRVSTALSCTITLLPTYVHTSVQPQVDLNQLIDQWTDLPS